MGAKNKIKKVNLEVGSKMWTYILLISIIALFLFANTLKNDYNLDDNLVTQNHSLTSSKTFSTVKTIFTSPYYKDNMGYSYGYRPVVMLSFFLEHKIFKESPTVSHFINLVLYVLTVILFFKLLISWFGDKGVLIALIATVIFIVHPTHAEVVASIKNRDEILAFLFAILSALLMNKYVEKNSLFSLLSISVLFALGMLSKKSVYPMSIILPVALILFKNISIKQLLFLSVSVMFPAALIGANFEIKQMLLLFVFPLIGTLCFYYVKPSEQKGMPYFGNYTGYIYSIVSWVLVAFSVWKHDYIYFLFAVPFSMLLVNKNQKYGIASVILQLLFVGYFLHIADLINVALIASIGFFIHDIINKKSNWVIAVLMIITIVFVLYIHPELVQLFFIAVVALFFILLFKKPLWGVLYILCGVTISVAISNVVLVQDIVVLSFTLFYIVDVKRKIPSFLRYSLGISFVFISIYICAPVQSNQPSQLLNSLTTSGSQNVKDAVVSKTSKSKVDLSGFIKENRPVGFVENPLIAPHSFGETVGTGFMVLGTYLKLMLFPQELSFYYGYSKITITDLNNLSVWLSIIAHIGLLVLAIWQINKRPIITFGIVWYGLSILLFSNWPQLVAGMVGERLAYEASAGFSIFIAGVILWVKPNFSFSKPKGVEMVVFAIFILLASRTFARNKEWKNSMALMGNDIEHLENSAQANNLYAIFLMKESVSKKISPQVKRNYRIKALNHFKRAVAIYPDFFNANFDVGRVYVEMKDNNNAKLSFLQAHKIKPNNIIILEELTRTSFDLKQSKDVLYYGNMYIQKDPFNEKIHELVAYTSHITKDKVSAKQEAERGLKYFPNNKNLQLILIESSK